MPLRFFGLLHITIVATDNIHLAVPNHILFGFEYMKYIYVTWSLVESIKNSPILPYFRYGQNTTHFYHLIIG